MLRFPPARLPPQLAPLERPAVESARSEPTHFTFAGVAVRFDPSLIVLLVCASFAVGLMRAVLLVLLVAGSTLSVESFRALGLRRCGVRPSIAVTALGSVLAGAPTNPSPAVRLVIGLAAPALHFSAAAVLWWIAQRTDAGLLLDWARRTHLALGLLQTLPVAPFDGVVLLDHWVPPTRIFTRLAIGLAAIVAAAEVGLSFLGSAVVMVPTVLAVVAVVRAFGERLAELNDRTSDPGVLLSIAHYQYEEGDRSAAALSAEQALSASRSSVYRHAAADLLALARSVDGPDEAERVLDDYIPEGLREPSTLAAIAHARGDHHRACELLLHARSRGERRRRSTRLLIDASIAAGLEEQALAIGIADAAILRTEELHAVRRFALEQRHESAVSALDAQLTHRSHTAA